MAAALITPYEFLMYGSSVKFCMVQKVTQNDWAVLDAPGIILITARNISGAVETPTYPTLTVKNTGTAYDADDTSMVYDGATGYTRASKGFYVLTASGEIMYVTNDSGYTTDTGTITVRRGCLGTSGSATGVANDNTLYVLSSVILGSATTGTTWLTYIALPNDPAVDMMP